MKPYLTHKNQIEGFRDVANTVKMVEKISASSLHILKQQVSNLNSYAMLIEKTLNRLQIFYKKREHPLLQKRKAGKKMLVILTGDKGLVGGLWHGVIENFLKNSGQYQSIVEVGAKGLQYLTEENMSVAKSFTDVSDVPAKKQIELITNYIFDEFINKSLLSVDILYPHFISLGEQQATLISFLPFKFKIKKEEKEVSAGLPIFEPSKKAVFESALKKYINVFFYKIVMETKLSELSARTVETEHASAKTHELIKKLTRDYVKERHQFITQKQLESFAVHKTI